MPRETNMDGSLHIEGDCCKNYTCHVCDEAVQHHQGVYAGMMYVCEQCPEDVRYWYPEGTYCRACERTKTHCEQRKCTGP